MQPDLPWNVAGIPPEARDAARAAARREGLSVGDWLTRRILRTFAEGNESVDTLRQSWRQPSQTLRSPQLEMREDTTTRDSDEMLARVSRSEAESQNAWKRIEDQLRGVTRRLDQAEHSQTENNRVMSKAAVEINVAAREQAQAFDLLGSQILGMNERLARLEREATNDGVKDAVRALHQGLSRLADQLSQTANQSATQIAALAGNVEQLAAKLIDARNDLDHVTHALNERVATAEARTRQAETQVRLHVDAIEKAVANLPARGDIDALAHALENRVGAVENAAAALPARSDIDALAQALDKRVGAIENATAAMPARSDIDALAQVLENRVGAVETHVREQERTAQARADSLDKAMAAIDASDAARKHAEAELQRHVSGLEQLNDTLDHLSARMTVDGAATAGTMARLEQSVAKLEMRGEDPEHRLQGIEKALSDLVTRLENTERNNIGAAGTVEEGLRNLAMRVEAADKRHREAVAELRAAVKEANGRLEIIDTPVTERAPALASGAHAGLAAEPPRMSEPAGASRGPTQAPPPPQFDLPPFPEEQGQPFATQPPTFAGQPLQPEPPPAFGDHTFGGNPFAPNAEQPAAGESFLAAARRAARSASSGEPETAPGPFGGLSWGAFRTSEPESESQSPIARYALIATLGLLIIAAIAAGAMLARSFITPTAPAATAAPAIAAPAPAPVPNAAAAPAPAASMVPDTGSPAALPATPAPGSPVIPQQPRFKPGPVETHPSTQPSLPHVTQQQPPQASPQAPPLSRLTALANAGNANAELLLGLKLLDGDGMAVNEAEAAKWLERAANQNVPVAAYRLGTLYERGHGVPADPTRAVQWYATAAKAGNRKAMHNLAVAYADGTGVAKDLVVAAQWFTRAANLGLADSQFNLAVLYERGMGVQQSLLDAYKWYAIAAIQGDTESKARIDALATQLSPEDKAAAQKAVDSFHPNPLDRNANTPPDISMVVNG